MTVQECVCADSNTEGSLPVRFPRREASIGNAYPITLSSLVCVVDSTIIVARNETTETRFLSRLMHSTTPPPQDYVTLLDIKDQVYSWWDHGLLSASFHPQFPQQPYLYIAVSRSKERSAVRALSPQ